MFSTWHDVAWYKLPCLRLKYTQSQNYVKSCWKSKAYLYSLKFNLFFGTPFMLEFIRYFWDTLYVNVWHCKVSLLDDFTYIKDYLEGIPTFYPGSTSSNQFHLGIFNMGLHIPPHQGYISFLFTRDIYPSFSSGIYILPFHQGYISFIFTRDIYPSFSPAVYILPFHQGYISFLFTRDIYHSFSPGIYILPFHQGYIFFLFTRDIYPSFSSGIYILPFHQGYIFFLFTRGIYPYFSPGIYILPLHQG